jgi:hypothetical protein
VLAAVAVVVACAGGGGPDGDATARPAIAPGTIPPSGADDADGAGPARMAAQSVPVGDTDPALATVDGDHLVVAPIEATGRLLVHFPGTRGRPDQYTTLLTHAGGLGLHAVGLEYDNAESINFDVCPGEGLGSGCHALARQEILYGTESGWSPPDVTPDDSALARLRALLEHLAATSPDDGWAAFLDPSGPDGIAWDRVTTSGHSQGGGHAAYVAIRVEVDRVVLLGATEPAAWTRVAPATPADAWWGLVHADEPSARAIERSWSLLGVPGAPAPVDDAEPPYGGSQQLVTASDACPAEGHRGRHHNCYSVDGFLPAGDDAPAYAEVWTHLLTG